MKSAAKVAIPAVLFVLFLALINTPVSAQEDRHPAYLHALTDLRHARAHLERPDGGELRHEEKDAIHAIDDAINEIKRASIDDGKDLNDHPPVDAKLDHAGRLHRALELLNKAHNDISREEDNQFAQGLQQRAMATSTRPIITSKKPSTGSLRTRKTA